MQAKEKYCISVDALKAYAEETDFTDVVIGVSGGIDSAVTLAMCVDAFGSSHVHGVMLPGPYSSNHSIDDAKELGENLGVRLLLIPITEPYAAFKQVLSEVLEDAFEGVAAENTQARCRMVCLMALSNAYGWMLVNTGNKSEAMMGYSTLYGDTAGAFAPLGGLYKTDVYAVGRWRNESATQAGDIAPIPVNIFCKPPSAELAPGQEDEKSLGVTYAELDRILIGAFERKQGAADLVSSEVDIMAVERVIETANSYAFKRAQEPPFPRHVFY